VVGIGFILQETAVTLVPPDDGAFGIARAGSGFYLLHRIGLVLEDDAGALAAQGDINGEVAIAGVGELASDRHTVRLRRRRFLSEGRQ
jgi:hypothetical protein